MQDKRDQLYDNLINSKKVSEKEIGSREKFKNAIKDEASSRQFYKNLIGSGIFGEKEIGTEDAFYNSIYPDFAGLTGTSIAESARNKKDDPYGIKAGGEIGGAIANVNTGVQPQQPKVAKQESAEQDVVPELQGVTQAEVDDARGDIPVDEDAIPEPAPVQSQQPQKQRQQTAPAPAAEREEAKQGDAEQEHELTEEEYKAAVRENQKAVVENVKNLRAMLGGRYANPATFEDAITDNGAKFDRLYKEYKAKGGTLTPEELKSATSAATSYFAQAEAMQEAKEQERVKSERPITLRKMDGSGETVEIPVSDFADDFQHFKEYYNDYSVKTDEGVWQPMATAELYGENANVHLPISEKELNEARERTKYRRDQFRKQIVSQLDAIEKRLKARRDEKDKSGFDLRLHGAQRMLDGIREALEQGDLARSNDMWKELKGALGGLASGFSDPDLYSLGVIGAIDNYNRAKAIDKYAKGEALTDTQKDMLELEALASAVSQYNGSYANGTVGYQSLKAFPESLGFMLALTASPGSGLAKVETRRAIRRLLKKYGNNVVSRMLASGTKAGLDVAEMAIATATTGAPRVAGDAMDRYMGNATFDINENTGNIEYGGQTDRKSIGKAFKESLGSNFIENYSEAMGEYFAPLKALLQVGAARGARKVGLNRLADAIFSTDTKRLSFSLKEFKEAAKFNGFLGEVLEEEVGMLMNALTVGDNSFKKSDDGYVFDGETQLVTALSCGFMSGTFSAIEHGGSKALDAYYNKRAEKADKAAQAVIGEDWAKLRDIIDVADMDGIKKALTEAGANGILNSQEKFRAATEYATRRLVAQGYSSRALQMEEENKAEETKGAEENAPEVIPVEGTTEEGVEPGIIETEGTAMERGENLDADGRVEAARAYRSAEEEVKAAFDITEDMDSDALYETIFQGNTLEDMEASGKYTPEQIEAAGRFDEAYDVAVGAYFNKETQAAIDAAVAERHAEIDSQTGSDGNIHGVTLVAGADGVAREGYITDPEVTFNEDGTVNAKDEMVIITIDGKPTPISVDEIDTYAEIANAEEEKRTAASDIAAQMRHDEEVRVEQALANQPQQTGAAPAEETAVQNAANAGETIAPTEDVSQAAPETQATNANEFGVPLREDGTPDYEKADPKATWQTLSADAEGDEEVVRTVASTMAEGYEKELKKVQKQKPQGSTPQEIMASAKANKAEVTRLTGLVNYWNGIATMDAPATEAAGVDSADNTNSVEPIQPVGKGVFGNIYDQFKGKVKEAFNFLLNNKSGDVLAVWSRDDVGDIDIVYGNREENKGLDHIIAEHVGEGLDFANEQEMMSAIDDVVQNGSINEKKSSWDKVTLEKDGKMVVISKNVRDKKGNIVDKNKNWVVTSFDSNIPKSMKQPAAATRVTLDSNEGGRAVTPTGSSEGKVTESSDTSQGNGQENVINGTNGNNKNKDAAAIKNNQDTAKKLEKELTNLLGENIYVECSSDDTFDVIYTARNTNGDVVFTFKGSSSKKGVDVNSVETAENYRRKGVAARAYQVIGQELIDNKLGTLRSNAHQHQLTGVSEDGRRFAPATKLWESLVNAGSAKKTKEGQSLVYEITPNEKAAAKPVKRKVIRPKKPRVRQRDEALGDYLDFYDFVLRALATSAGGRDGIRIVWGNDPVTGTHGLGGHLFGNPPESERRKYLWLLGSRAKGAKYPEQLAEDLWQWYREELGSGADGIPIDDIGSEEAADAFGVVLEALRAHTSAESMMRDAEERHSSWESKEERYYRAQADEWAMGYGFDDIDEYEAYWEQWKEDIEANGDYYDEILIKFAEEYADEEAEQEAAYWEQRLKDAEQEEEAYRETLEQEADKEYERRSKNEGKGVGEESDTGAVQRGTEESPAVVQGEQEVPAGRRATVDDATPQHDTGEGTGHNSHDSLVSGTGEGQEVRRFTEGLEAQGTIPHGTAVAKFKASDFASKDKLDIAPVLGGTYHDPDGYAVTTDGFVLIADKERFDPAQKGKVIAERNIPKVAGKGMEIQDKYPNWKAVVPEGGQQISVDWNDLLGFIAGVRAKMKAKYDELREAGELEKTSFRAYTEHTAVQVRLPNGEIVVFDMGRLERLATAGVHLGTTEMRYNGTSRAVASSNDNGIALAMPMRYVPDDYTSYYYDMAGSDMAGEPQTFYNTLDGQQVVYQNMFDTGNGENGQTESAATPTAPVQQSLFDQAEAQTQPEGEKQNTEKPKEDVKAKTEPQRTRTKTANPHKIDDFGKKIGGARKDVARGRIRDTKKMSVKDLTTLKKGPDDILSQTNILRLYKDGQMDEATARSFMAFNNVAKQAIKRFGRMGVESVLTKYRDAAVAWEEGKPFSFEVSDEDVKAYMAAFPMVTEEKARESLTYIITDPMNMFMQTYEALSYPAVERRLGQYVIMDYTKAKVKIIVTSRPVWVKNGYHSQRGYPFRTFEQAVAKLKELCPETKGEETKRKGEKSEHGLRVVKDGYVFYVKSRNIPGNIFLSPKFYTEKEAQAYLDNNLENLKAREQRIVDALLGSNIGMAEREGVDYRNGRDVTPQDFLDEFDFRGVEFGNWVPQGERQLYLNKTYDAIKDFCAIVGISPRAFSLGGKLGLAFGARGKSRAMAHYEPAKVVINLTRMSGVGSLAHEWFHALDNYLAKNKSGNMLDMATVTHDVVRDELSAVFKEMYKVMRAMDYHFRSRRAGTYWAEVEEEFARMFENYIYNKLTAKQVVSPVLVRQDALFDDVDDITKRWWPYPSKAENAEMAPLFDKLFDTIQEKTDADGHAVLYEPMTVYGTHDGQRVIYQSLFGGKENSTDNTGNSRPLSEMSDAELLERMAEGGPRDRDFFMDEYDQRHEQEYDDSQLAYAESLEQNNVSLEDAYDMFNDVWQRWNAGGYATDERTALRAQLDALQPYIDFLESERYDEEMEAERERERQEAQARYEQQKQEVAEAFNPTNLRMRKLAKGETCHVERVYEETGQFNFTGKEKIESAEDVAFIFRQLENAAVENSFLVLLKDGQPTVIHLAMGGYAATMAPHEKAFVAYKALKPDAVYFVHNHPSGNLKASRQDQATLNAVKQAFGLDIVQQGIIIDTTSGMYGEFESIETAAETYSVTEEMPEAQGDEVPIKVYQFSKQVFSPDWNPVEAFKADSSKSVAEFISSHRLGEHKKMSFLVVSPDMRVVANVFLPWTKLSDIKSQQEAGDLLAGYVHQCGGVRGVLYGNYDYSPTEDNAILRGLQVRMKQLNAPLMDVLHIEHSAYESGLIGEPEVGYNAVNDPQFQLADSESVRPATQEEREETAYMAEHLNAMGIPTSTDWEKGQRVLDMVNGEATLSRAQKRALETAPLIPKEGSPADISNADSAKVQQKLETLAKNLEKVSSHRKNFLDEVADALGAKKHGSNSRYVTIEAKNGKIVAIRLSNHNATVSTFDKHDEDEGISIVVSPRSNQGMNDDGNAHIVEFFYPEIAIRKAEGKPLAEIVRSIEQSLYSGEYKDTTGLAEVQEVNAGTTQSPAFHRVYHGSGADFDRFDHSFMGSGEGAQAYGWGSYVTEVEGIGRKYAVATTRKPMGSRPVLYKGEDYRQVNQRGWSDAQKGAFETIAEGMRGAGRSEYWAKQEALNNLNYLIQINGKGVERNKKAEKEWNDAIAFLNGMTDEQYSQFVKSGEWIGLGEGLRDLKYAINDNLDLGRGGVLLVCEQRAEEAKQNLELYANRKADYENRYEALKAFDENDFSRADYEPMLYTVEIPDDNGNNYLDYESKMEQQEGLLDSIGEGLEQLGWKRNGMTWSNATHRAGYELAPYKTGKQIYGALSNMLGSDKFASRLLHSAGITGIKYPAQYTTGGRSDNAKNYVIFDENDLKITNKVKFFRTPDGHAYGFTLGGKIYLDPRIATAETPLHEYGHLWGAALREANPEAWAQLVSGLEKDAALVDYVKRRYPGLEGDELWDEVFAHFGGRKGKERMDEERRKMMDEEPTLVGKARVAAMFHRLAQALKRFWEMSRDLFAGKVKGLKDLTPDDFANMMMNDFVKGFKPESKRQGTKAKYQFIGEQGARRADLMEERTHRIDNLGVARDMESAGKDAVAIKLATGWERGGDGKWRYEISDVSKDAVVKGLREPIKEHRKAVGDLERKEDTLRNKAWALDDKIPGRITGKYTEEEKAGFRKMKQDYDAYMKEASEARDEINALNDKVEKEGYETTLGGVLGKDSELIQAYPSLADVKVKIYEHLKGKEGSYSAETNTLELNAGDRSIDKVYSTLLHEVQHAIQHIEGFARGGNLSTVLSDNAYLMNFRDNLLGTLMQVEKQLQETRDLLAANDFSYFSKEALESREARLQLDKSNLEQTMADIDNGKVSLDVADRYYRRLSGEVEARNVQRRRDYSDEERRRTLAAATEDVDRSEQHFLLGDDESASMGDAAETFDERQKKAVENKGTVMPGLNEAQVKIVGDIPRHRYTGNIAKATQQAIDAAKAKYAPNGEPKTLHYNNFGAEFDYSISGNAIETVLSPKHQGKSENKGVHLALAEHLDRVIGESIEVEEHPDRLKTGNVRDNTKINPDALMHRFYGVARIDGKDYRVMTLMKEESRQGESNGIHSYEVQKIEVLDEKTPNTPNGVGTPNSELEAYPLAKLLHNVGKTMEKDKNLLDESKKISVEDISNNGYGEYSEETLFAEEPSGQPRFSLPSGNRYNNGGDVIDDDKVLARATYEQRLRTALYQIVEAIQDSMLALKEVYRAIATAEGVGDFRIEDIPSYENAYLAENALSSVNKAEMDYYAEQVFKPLMDEVAKLAKNKKGRQALNDYLMAKHGLERNQVMAERNFKKYQAEHPNGKKTLDDFRQDYSGLTAIFGEAGDSLADIEGKAMDYVDDYENWNDTDDLWDRIREATHYSLVKSYMSGIINKNTFDEIEAMYEYYVPLRGFDETTSDEVYTYLNGKDGVFNAPVKTAKGRTSKADDPLATIKNMADSSILQGNRNLMKQKFLNYVMRHRNDIASVQDLWLQYDAATDEWKPVFPNILPDDTPEEVERKVNEFEERMNELQEQYPDNYKKGHEASNIPFRVIGGNLGEHQVLVKRNGRAYVITINGNPRAAQALNGQTNPDNETSGAVGAILRYGERINRKLSQLYTTMNPSFVVANFLRDIIYSNSMVWVKESPKYALRFNRNCNKLHPGYLSQLFKKYNSNTLDMNNDTERYFAEFMKGGGETGYSNLKSVDDQKKEIEKELKRTNGKGLRLSARLRWLGEVLDNMNRTVENCARFAAFVTSRQSGRDIPRSVWDAKEISVNFNKKGAGSKFLGKNDTLGNIAALISGLGRALFVFWNAGVQGTANISRHARRNPVKFSTLVAGSQFAAGALIPVLAMAMGGGDGDDEDKNAYYNLPEYVRRSNIMFRFGGQWLAIPLPIEFRAIYGLGELMTGVATGHDRYKGTELAYQVASQLSQVLPLDFLEGGGGLNAFIPSFVKPLIEAGLNKSWSGLPIYKENGFNEKDPAWKKAYKRTDPHLVSLSRMLNEATRPIKKRSGIIDINPAQLEYVLNGYLSAFFKIPQQLSRLGETIFGDREFEWRNVPIVERVIKSGDERTEARKLANDFFEYKEEADDIKHNEKEYSEDAVNGDKKMAKLKADPGYERAKIFEEYRPLFDGLYDAKKDAGDEEKKVIEDRETALRRNMVNLMHAVEGKKNPNVQDSIDTMLKKEFENPDGLTSKKAASVIAKRMGGEDTYGSPQNEYGKIYLHLRDYFDLAEDVLLQAAEKQARQSGDEEREKAVRKARLEVTNFKKVLLDVPYKTDGGVVTEADVMYALRQKRKEKLRELGITGKTP